MTLNPTSGRVSETEPSAVISRSKSKVCSRKRADRSGSATVSETADAVTFNWSLHLLKGGEEYPCRTRRAR